MVTSQFEHKYLLDKLQIWMQADGYRGAGIFSVQGYEPDLIGLNADGRYANGEAKTPDRFKTERTKNKLKAFGTAKEKDGKWIPLYVAVSKGQEKAMKKVIEDLLDETAHIEVKGF